MAFTRVINVSITDGAGSQIAGAAPVTLTNDMPRDADVLLNGAKTNLEISWVADISQLSYVYFFCEEACSIFTNAASTGAPQETIALAAGVPRIWIGSPWPFLGDVTKLFVTKAGAGTTTVLKIRSLEDATP